VGTLATLVALLDSLDPEKILRSGGYLLLLLVGVFVAAVAGDQVGYAFGNKAGPALFKRPDSRFFKREHVESAEEFFEHHGPKAIVLARFVPIVRTFTPIVAGAGNMQYRTFVKFNVLGGLLWGVGVTLIGYFMGNIAIVHDNLEIAILLIVAISVVPMAIEIIKSRRLKAKLDAEA
jgi:membrane-associated protein